MPGREILFSINQVFTGKIPYDDINNDVRVINAITNGVLPPHPPQDLCISCGLDDAMWDIIEACWKMHPGDRLSASSVVESLSLLRSPDMTKLSLDGWDVSFIGRLRSDLTNELPIVADLAYTANIAQYSTHAIQIANRGYFTLARWRQIFNRIMYTILN